MLIDLVKNELKSLIAESFGVDLNEVVLVTPPDVKLGDVAFKCFALAKELKMNPNDIAAKIASKFKCGYIVNNIEAVGPYVNLTLNPEVVFKYLYESIVLKKKSFIKPHDAKNVMLEFLSPNTNKPLHLGHLRNGILGMSLSNILQATGSKVLNVNLVNDRGVHICKSMLAWKLFSNSETPLSSGVKGDHFVGSYYVKFAQEAKKDNSLNEDAQNMLKKWEENDFETINLWKMMNEWVYAGFEITYADFGFKFDKIYYESETYKLGKEIVEAGAHSDLFKLDKDGSYYFQLPNEFGLEKNGELKKITVLRNDGTSVYMTQDIGTTIKKNKDYKMDQFIFIVGSEQKHHFKCLFQILKSMGQDWVGNCVHFPYGMVNLPDGKMKSREGNVVDADNLLMEVEKLALGEISKRCGGQNLCEDDFLKARKIALAAIKFYLLKFNPEHTISFNAEDSISFDGFTGPYCQYAYARAMKLLREVNISNMDQIDFSLLNSEDEIGLARIIMDFPRKIKIASDSLNPSIVANHVFDLAKAFNQFYHNNPVLKVENSQLKKARLLLVLIFTNVIKLGLGLLGIDVVENM